MPMIALIACWICCRDYIYVCKLKNNLENVWFYGEFLLNFQQKFWYEFPKWDYSITLGEILKWKLSLYFFLFYSQYTIFTSLKLHSYPLYLKKRKKTTFIPFYEYFPFRSWAKTSHEKVGLYHHPPNPVFLSCLV